MDVGISCVKVFALGVLDTEGGNFVVRATGDHSQEEELRTKITNDVIRHFDIP